jgi:uncharacterized protein YlxW (UPF0749 family)
MSRQDHDSAWTGPGGPLGVMANLVADATASDYGREGSRRRMPVVITVIVVAACAFILILAFVRTREAAPVAADERRALAARVIDRTLVVRSQQEAVDLERLALVVKQQEVLAATAAGRALADRVLVLQQLAGALPAEGPGLALDLKDPPRARADDIFVPSLNRILDRDLQTVVNSLWLSGAVAVAINDQRLTSRTAIRSAGAAILVDYRPVLSPYRIVAITSGEIAPAELAQRFSQTPGSALLRSLRDEYGIESAVSLSGSLRVPAASLGAG